MARVLIVEDDNDIAHLIARYVIKEGHQAEVLPSGAEALDRIRRAPPDLLILDLMLPGIDGLELCRELRRDAGTAGLPVLMLTARGEEADRVRGLEVGADDYVTKPFSPRELVLRVAALLRRSASDPSPDETVRIGPLLINSARHVVLHNGVEVKLTAKEFLLLDYLRRHRGRVLTREQLLRDVWGYVYTGGTRTVDVHIRRLREKLPPLNDAIVTIKQFGYRLD